jgi:flagellar hook-length control protein FliK
VTAEVPPLTQPGTQAAPTKAGKTGGSVEDAKGAASDATQAAVPASQPNAPASSAPSDPTNAKTPSGSTPQDSQPDASAKPVANTDNSAAPAPASHSAAVDPRTAPQSASTPAASDASTIAQTPLINVPAPTTAANATPINVANLTVVAGPAVPLNGLAVEIAANSKAGNSRFQIRLDPPDLGRIDVRLDVDRNGQVTSRLFVEKSETLDLLRRDAPQLHQALQDAGLKTSDNGLQFSLRDQNPQQGRNDGNGTGQDPQRLVIAEEDPAVAEAAGRSYARSLSAAGGVDIRV